MQRYVSKIGRLLTKHLLSNRELNYLKSRSISVTTVRCFVQANSYQTTPILLEKNTTRKREFTVNDLLQYINNGKVFYLKQLTNVFHTIDFSILKPEEIITLLKCCGASVPDSSREQRNKVCQDIFTGLQKNNNLNIDVYNTYLRTCNENGVYLNYNSLFPLKCEPTKDTLKLLLKNVCQQGQISDALSLLELMKQKNIPIDSDIFNDLILAHTIEGGVNLAETVIRTMRTAHIEENNDTILALLVGLIKRNDFQAFVKVVDEYPVKFTQNQLLTIIEELGLSSNESWLSKIFTFENEVTVPREFQTEIEKICIHLIHMGKPESAMNIYTKFITPFPDVSYGYNLLKEMIHCNIDITTIISMARDLAEKGYNENILENLTEVALRFRYIEQSWALLRNLKTLRPHYFWPILVHIGKVNGENGIFSVLENIKELNIKPDAETLENYVFPHCDQSNVKLLVLKLQDYGFTVKEILSPLIMVLLRYKKIRPAVNACNLYNVGISGEKLLEQLSTSWGQTKDAISILVLLRRYCESNVDEQDLVGRFLVSCSKLCKNNDDFRDFLKLIEMIGETKLRISTYSSKIVQDMAKNCSNESLKNDIEANINLILDFDLKLSEDTSLIHPRNMDLTGLECHLIELQEKNMETRGVIRRLIQMHARRGNLDRVKELRKIFLDSGYEESAGIKSSVLHNYVLAGYLNEAMDVYEELKIFDPEFILDSFKFIDLARLLIQNDKFPEGYRILQNEIAKSNIILNSKSISRNCRELLSSCKTGEQMEKVFALLVKNDICKPTNVLLGPLIKVHLKSGDLNKAVHKYVELSQQYRCTPCQLELLCAVAKEENSLLLHEVIKATEAVHGPGPAQMGLISALAENGQGKALTKTLDITNVSIKGLLKKRCARWVEEGKIDPLKCLLKACARLPEEFVNIHFIYKCIFDIYDLNRDYVGALAFYESIPEETSFKMYFEKDLQRLHNKHCNVNKSENVKIRNKI